jgi:hypothetical protein
MTLTIILKELLSHFEALNSFYTANCTGSNRIIKSEDVGLLLPLKCGHRGKPSRTEEKVLEYFLNESGFLDPHFVPSHSDSEGDDDESD